jgi:hypothetical protein
MERREREMTAITHETAAQKDARHAAIRAALEAGLDAGMHDPYFDVDTQTVRESAAPFTSHDPAGCGCGAHQGGPGDVAPISVDALTATDPDVEYRGESDRRFVPCLICCVHTAHMTAVCVDCRPRVLARLAYEASRVSAPNALQLSHAAADAYAASIA